MTNQIELIMRFHPVGGEDLTLLCEDFTSEQDAVQAITRALDERRSLVLTRAKYDRESGEHAVIVNLANVVSVRISTKDSDTTGQYL